MMNFDFYFNNYEATNFISTHTQDELKQELENANSKSKDILSKWSLFDDAKELVQMIFPDIVLDNENDIYFQAKAILASQYVEYRKYVEFLEEFVDN